MLYLYKDVIIIAENKLADLSMDFAVSILKLTYDNLKSLMHDCGAIRRMLIILSIPQRPIWISDDISNPFVI